MSIRTRVRDLLRLCGHALSTTVHERLDAIERRLDQLERSQPRPDPRAGEVDAALLQASIHIIESLHALAGRTVVETGGSSTSGSPEQAMAALLYSYLPHRAAIQMDERTDLALAGAGYEVYTFEAGRDARGSVNGAGAPAVVGAGAAAASSLGGIEIQRAREIPDAIGLAVFGGDAIARLRETGDFGSLVIAADLEADFPELAAEMRRRDYPWHVALYRSPVRAGASYFANYPGGVPDARGTVFFFRDFRVFSEAQAWCAATLPRTYFRPPQD